MNCFLNLIIMLSSLIKVLLHFKRSLVLKSIRYVVYLSSCLLFHISFFSFVSLSFILAKGLIRLINITREVQKFDNSEIYFVLT